MPAAKLVKIAMIAGGGLLALLALLFVGWGVINLTATSTGLQTESTTSGFAPGVARVQSDALGGGQGTISYQPSPTPYTHNLEAYETTDYRGHAQTERFAEACATLRTLKAEERFHFQSLTERRNQCSATFFTEEVHAADARAALARIDSIDLSRTTRSVTRLRARIDSQIDILEDRLRTIETTLTEAEADYDALRVLAREERDTESLTRAITDKIEVMEMLSERETRLTQQLTRLHRQAQDLEERLGMVKFNVSVERLFPIMNEDRHRFARAWDRFSDQLTFMGIALTAYLATFLLWMVQAVIYLAIVLVFARLLWFAVRLLWRRREK